MHNISIFDVSLKIVLILYYLPGANKLTIQTTSLDLKMSFNYLIPREHKRHSNEIILYSIDKNCLWH